MIEHVKYISPTTIIYAPKNYITDDGQTILNFNTDEEVMLQYGFKPFVRAEISIDKSYSISYKEYEECVLEIATELPSPTPEEIAEERRQRFHEEFFQTSLGYVRRMATKANGEKVDFLLGYLPIVKIAVEQGLIYPLILYEEPDFTKDITDWTIYQHRLPATEQFIKECLNQVANDFKPQVQPQQNEGE